VEAVAVAAVEAADTEEPVAAEAVAEQVV